VVLKVFSLRANGEPGNRERTVPIGEVFAPLEV